MDLFLRAMRNIRRNRRRTVLNSLSLAVGIACLLLCLGWIRGYFTTLYAGIRLLETGDLQVLNSAYLDEEIRFPLDLSVQEYGSLRRKLLGLQEAEEVTGRIETTARIGFKGKSLSLLVRVIDPGPESRVTRIADSIVKGSYLRGSPGLLIGRPTADKLGIRPGDFVGISVRDAYGTDNYDVVPVSGIFLLNYAPIDKNFVYIGMDRGAPLLGLENAVTRMVIKLSPSADPQKSLVKVKDLIGTRPELTAYSWQTFAQTLIQGVKADTGGFLIMVLIIFLLIIINMYLSMSATVRERSAEIGTFRAIGMKRRQVLQIFLYETFALVLLGTAAAAVFSGPFIYYLVFRGIDVAAVIPENFPFPFGTRFHGDYRIIDFFAGFAAGLLAAVAGTLRPVFRETRKTVAEGLRSIVR